MEMAAGLTEMSIFVTGLVVGKFAPLHRGHQFLLERASAQCSRLIILSYAKPERDGSPPERRETWLKHLYPQATVVVIDDDRLAQWCREVGAPVRAIPHDNAEADNHRQFVAWLLRELIGQRVDAVFTSEAYGDGFARVLSESQHNAPVVQHVLVDIDRLHVPISATRIRSDVHAYREWLDPFVYASFIQRIALLGGESTGKTTLAQALAQELNTTWVPEYGRELWERRGGELRFEDMLHIAETQLAHEQHLACGAHRYLVCDTTPLTTLIYSEELFGRADPQLRALAQRSYDRVFLCGTDFGFVQDGTRRDAAFQARQQTWFRQRLSLAGTRFMELAGSIPERLVQVIEVLSRPEAART